MSDFASYSGITIPEGKVKRITRKSDGVVLWEGIKVPAAYPAQTGTLTYSGASQTPSWSNYDANIVTIGGDTSGTDAGDYTATFTPKSGYTWPDGTNATVSVTWTISRATISSVPSQKTSLTYTGSSQTVSWNNYDSSKMSYSGTKKATNAGTYTATFTPNSNYMWSGGSTSAKSVTWTIGKATPTLTVSPSTVTMTTSEPTAEIAITYTGDGKLSCVSTSSTRTGGYIENNKLHLYPKARFSNISTGIEASEGTNYGAISSGRIYMTCTYTPIESVVASSADSLGTGNVSYIGPTTWTYQDMVNSTFNYSGRYTIVNGILCFKGKIVKRDDGSTISATEYVQDGDVYAE